MFDMKEMNTLFNIEMQKVILMQLLIDYLNSKNSIYNLNKYAWEIIDTFNNTPNSQLPPELNIEKTFWYTIWQIQHLFDKNIKVAALIKRR